LNQLEKDSEAMRNRDIIITSLQPFYLPIGSNCINIAEELSKQNRVLYVNYAFDRSSIKREKDKPQVKIRHEMKVGLKPNLELVKENLWTLSPTSLLESINWLPFTFLFRLFNRINNKRFSSEIKKAIDELNFKNYIIFTDSDMFRSYHLKEMLKPALSIYYTRDNMMSVPYWQKHGHLLEAEFMSKVDLVCANSTYLASLAQKYNINSFYVGQGCDISAFNPRVNREVPEDMRNIKQPIIGYIGALYTLRLDLEIIRKIAKKEPAWNIVLIGPEDEGFKNSDLHQLPNVHFLGAKPGNVLADYLYGFDVAINPQILNEVTIGNYPRKIDEYLAMGKPTVATGTKAMEIFAEHCYLAQTSNDYAPLIKRALVENNPQKIESRMAFAATHTWKNSVKAIYDSIEKVKPSL
jgi:glycosyltransferase involved in cell wall biosynthesis